MKMVPCAAELGKGGLCRERHLNGAVLEGSAFSRPAVLMTDAANALYVPAPDARPAAEKAFLDAIMATLRADGMFSPPLLPFSCCK